MHMQERCPWRLGPLDRTPREEGVSSVVREATSPKIAELRQAGTLEVSVLGPEGDPREPGRATAAAKDRVAGMQMSSVTTVTRRDI